MMVAMVIFKHILLLEARNQERRYQQQNLFGVDAQTCTYQSAYLAFIYVLLVIHVAYNGAISLIVLPII